MCLAPGEVSRERYPEKKKPAMRRLGVQQNEVTFGERRSRETALMTVKSAGSPVALHPNLSTTVPM